MNETKKIITGKITTKTYKCSECNDLSKHSTNHYGQIYCRCNNCSWKSPMSPIKVMECQEPLPEGWGRPENWKIARLGDVVDIS